MHIHDIVQESVESLFVTQPPVDAVVLLGVRCRGGLHVDRLRPLMHISLFLVLPGQAPGDGHRHGQHDGNHKRRRHAHVEFCFVAIACPWAGESWNLQEIDLDEVARTFQEPDTREDNIWPRDLKDDEATQHLLQTRCDQILPRHPTSIKCYLDTALAPMQGHAKAQHEREHVSALHLQTLECCKRGV